MNVLLFLWFIGSISFCELSHLRFSKMADSRSSKEGSADVGHGSATGSSSPTDDSSHSSPSKVRIKLFKLYQVVSIKISLKLSNSLCNVL